MHEHPAQDSKADGVRVIRPARRGGPTLSGRRSNRQPGTAFSAPSADRPGRGTDGDGARGDFTGDDRVGPDDAAIADRGAGEDGDVVSKPDVVSDAHATGGDEWPLAGRRGWITGCCPGAAVAAVGVIADQNATATEQVVANYDPIDAGNMDVVGEPGRAADADLRVKVGSSAGFRVGRDRLKPKKVAGVKVGAEMHAVGAEQPWRTRCPEAGGVQAPRPETVANTAEQDGHGVPWQIKPAMRSCGALRTGKDGQTSGCRVPHANIRKSLKLLRRPAGRLVADAVQMISAVA